MRSLKRESAGFLRRTPAAFDGPPGEILPDRQVNCYLNRPQGERHLWRPEHLHFSNATGRRWCRAATLQLVPALELSDAHLLHHTLAAFGWRGARCPPVRG